MRSWNAWYGLFAVMVAFGSLSLFGVSSLRKSDTWHHHQELVMEGLKAIGHVTDRHTFNVGKDTRANLSYSYEVNGKQHEGVAETTPGEYLQYEVGSPITVTYLPNSPAESEFQPQDWIDHELGTEKMGFVMVICGIALAALTAILDWRRRIYPTSQMNDIGNSYYSKSFLSVFGTLFLAAGIVCQIAMIEQVSSPKPLVYTMNGIPEVAGLVQKVFIVLFAVPFWVIGSLVLLYWKQFSITTSPEGVSVTLPFGKSWKAGWNEVQFIRKQADSYQLVNGKNRAWVQNSTENYKKLRAEIEQYVSKAAN
jgi:hypothetical protein